MVDYKRLLDVVVGSLGRGAPAGTGHPQGGMMEKLSAQASDLTRQSPDQLLQKAKDLAAQHPGLTQAALVGLAGLLFRGRKKGLASGLVKLGGLAAIGGLAYRALQSRNNAESSLVDQSADVLPSGGVPSGHRLHSVMQTEDDTILLLRTMIAAASADGQIDDGERARILKGMNEAGVDPQSSSWLENEFASPADVDSLAESVNDREMASQVYTAARITIDPDTLQEREFLRRLALAVDLDDEVVRQIDDSVSALRNT